MTDIIQKIDDILHKRHQGFQNGQKDEKSYTQFLFSQGTDKILDKVKEESAETVEAAQILEKTPSADNQSHLTYEVADLWFHTLVLLQHQGLSGQAVLNELARRFGLSGIEEKESRNKE